MVTKNQSNQITRKGNNYPESSSNQARSKAKALENKMKKLDQSAKQNFLKFNKKKIGILFGISMRLVYSIRPIIIQLM